MMRLFNKVAIVGTGLIGGSIALAIKRKQLANEVIGVSRKKSSILLARRKGVIDRGSQELGVVRDADLLIFATPVEAIVNLAPRISRLIRPGCLVTDVGSTKKEIAEKLEKLFPQYVGSHPLAGSEKRGVINADSGLFKNSLCILTPTRNTDRKALAKVKKLWNKVGAKTVSLSPDTHDRIFSFVSHLPHLVAFSLIGAMPAKYLKFASGGLKDTTRIAASDASLWREIFFSNQKNILKTIGLFQKNIAQIKSAIRKKDKKLLTKILNEAKVKREILK